MHLIFIVLIALEFANPALAQSPSLLNSLFGQSQSSQSTPKPNFPPVKAPVQATPQTSSQGSSQASPPETVGEIRPEPQQSAVITANRDSQAFGASLFTGAFARQGPTQFNPDYLVAVGDSIRLRLWGSATLDDVLLVDPQGNIFIPAVGPVKILGVRNKDLQSVIEKAVHKMFRSNVYSYAN